MPQGQVEILVFSLPYGLGPPVIILYGYFTDDDTSDPYIMKNMSYISAFMYLEYSSSIDV